MTTQEPDGVEGENLNPTLLDVVVDLRRDVRALELPLRTDATARARDVRLDLLSQIDDHLLPRLREMSRPAIVAVVGSTGAGKSTIVNSLLRAEVSRASVIRPTTREPVLVHHPADADLLDAAVLQSALRVDDANVPRGMALLDAPDLDSLLRSNRDMAARLLVAADLGLFVTTASRYGDALPWQVLSAARERGATMAMILNRVTKDKVAEVRVDLLARLREHQMESTPLFIVPDAGPHEGLLPEAALAPILAWLRTVAGIEQTRRLVVRTLRGSLGTLAPQVRALVDAVEEQARDAERLGAQVSAVAGAGVATLERVVADGSLGAGALGAAWAAAVQTDPSLLRTSSGLLRPSARSVRRREEALASVHDAAVSAVAELFSTAAVESAEAIVTALAGDGSSEALSGGAALVAAVDGDDELRTWRARSAAAAAQAWAGDAGRAVDERATDGRGAAARRRTGERGLRVVAEAAALGVQGAGRVLDGLLGPAVAAELVAELRALLMEGGSDVVRQEEGPYAERLDVPALGDGAATALSLRLAELRRVL